MLKLHQLIGHESQFSMKHRITNIILIFGSVISFWCAFTSYLLRLNTIFILTRAIIGLLLLGIYYLSRVRKKYYLSIFLALLLTTVVIPMVWFSHGGIAGNVPLYLTLFSPVAVILLEGYKRFAITAVLTLLMVALIAIEYFNPTLVSHPDHTVKYIDLSIALVSSIIASSLFLTLIIRNYEEEHQKAKKYLLQSDTDRNRLQYLSFHDALTGLYNRTFFEAELQRLEAVGTKDAAIFVVDIDGLKFTNDTLGHSQGDQIIVRTSRILKSSFPDNDMIFRTGGDEFIILLQEATLDKLETYYQRILDKVKRDNAMTFPVLPLQMSVGYTFTKDGSKSIQKLLIEAENKMYREKLFHHAGNSRSMLQTVKEMLAARDYNTGVHVDHLGKIMVAFAKAAGVPDSSMSDLRLFTKFHDIGKIGISDRILLKPARLNEEEMHEMRRHCEIGYRIACATSDLLPIADWILRHHEWWNGQGYPLGLKGADIPFECRLLAIADSYDAMTSDRPYRKAIGRDAAIEELKKYAGIQFDPELVKIFISIESKFAR